MHPRVESGGWFTPRIGVDGVNISSKIIQDNEDYPKHL
jgi:hypothetical protein